MVETCSRGNLEQLLNHRRPSKIVESVVRGQERLGWGSQRPGLMGAPCCVHLLLSWNPAALLPGGHCFRVLVHCDWQVGKSCAESRLIFKGEETS